MNIDIENYKESVFLAPLLCGVAVLLSLCYGCEKRIPHDSNKLVLDITIPRQNNKFSGAVRKHEIGSIWKISSSRISHSPLKLNRTVYGVDDRPGRGKSDVYVHREWWVEKLKSGKSGLEKIFAGVSFYPDRELGIFYTQTVDAEKRTPVYRRYGDRFMRFKSIARVGWNFQNFIRITLERDGLKFKLRRKYVLTDIYIMEIEGKRAVADFVFKLDGEGDFACIRCVVYADKPTWLWAEVYVIGTRYHLNSVELSSFGGYLGSRYPLRQRWFAGLGKHLRMEKSDCKLDTKQWPMLIIHHKNTDENFGSLGVFETEALKSMFTSYLGMGVRLVPKEKLNRVRFGIADYHEPDERIIAKMRKRWPEYKKFFSEISWNVDFSSGIAFAERMNKIMGEEFLDSAPGRKMLAESQCLRNIALVSSKNRRMKELDFGRRFTRFLINQEENQELAATLLLNEIKKSTPGN